MQVELDYMYSICISIFAYLMINGNFLQLFYNADICKLR